MKPMIENAITHGLKLSSLLSQDQTPAMTFLPAFAETNGGGFNSQRLITNMEVASDRLKWTRQEAQIMEEEILISTLTVMNKFTTGTKVSQLGPMKKSRL